MPGAPGGRWPSRARSRPPPPGRQCGTVRVTAVSFGPTARTEVLAAGSCGATGTTAFFDSLPRRRVAAAQPAGLRPAGAARRGHGAGPGQGGADRAVAGRLVRVRAAPGSTAAVKRDLDRVRAAAGHQRRSSRPAGWPGQRQRRRAERGCCCLAGRRRRSAARGSSGCCFPRRPPQTSVLASGPGQLDRRAGRLRGDADRVAARPRVDRLDEGADHERADSVRLVQLAPRPVRSPACTTSWTTGRSTRS